MTLKIQIIVIAVALLAVIVSLILIKKDKLGLKIAMPWLIVLVIIIIFALAPVLLDKLADLLGVYDPLNMVLFLAGIFIMLIIYSLTITVYSNRKKIRELVQKLAYLEEKLKPKEEQDGQ